MTRPLLRAGGRVAMRSRGAEGVGVSSLGPSPAGGGGVSVNCLSKDPKAFCSMAPRSKVATPPPSSLASSVLSLFGDLCCSCSCSCSCSRGWASPGFRSLASSCCFCWPSPGEPSGALSLCRFKAWLTVERSVRYGSSTKSPAKCVPCQCDPRTGG